jgi:hypothetical protein
MPVHIARIAVTRPPDHWFHGITRALFDLYRRAFVDLGMTIFEVPVDAFLPPDVVRISALLEEMRAFRPELAVGLSHGAHALICRLPAQRDGWKPNFFTDVLDVPTLCIWDHAPLEFADQLLGPHPASGASEGLQRVLTHPRLIHWSRDSGQSRIMKELGFLRPDRVIHEFTPSLPGFLPCEGITPQPGVGFIGHVYQELLSYSHPALAELAGDAAAEWLESSVSPLWDVLIRRISAMKPGLRERLGLHPDNTCFWRFAHRLIAHEAQTSARLKMLGAAHVPVTCYGDLRKDLPGVPQNLLPALGEIPFGPPLADALARHSITIDVLNPGFVNGYSHKPVLGFASGGFVLVNRKVDFIGAFGEAGESVSYSGADELRTKVDRFLSLPARRREVGDAIRERIRVRFQLNDVLRRVLEAASQRMEPARPNAHAAKLFREVTTVANLLPHLRSKPEWNTTVEASGRGVIVSLPPIAWAMGAAIWVPPITRGMNEPHLRIEVLVQEGRVGIGREPESEQLVSPSADPITVTVELPKGGEQTVILRNTLDAATRVIILSVSLCDRACGAGWHPAAGW